MRIVRALEAEHHALDTQRPIVAIDDLPVLLASTADKIVALGSLSRRAAGQQPRSRARPLPSAVEVAHHHSER